LYSFSSQLSCATSSQYIWAEGYSAYFKKRKGHGIYFEVEKKVPQADQQVWGTGGNHIYYAQDDNIKSNNYLQMLRGVEFLVVKTGNGTVGRGQNGLEWRTD